MSARNKKPYAYAKVTRLSDDFKRLEHTPTPTKDVGFKRPIDYCAMCMGHFRETRTLACHHRFCRECLQLSIDSAPVIPDPDRGFECVLCGYFTKVPNYSIARTEWAALMTSDYLQQQLVSTTAETDPVMEQAKDKKDQDVQTNEWRLIWQISAYSRAYLRTRRLNPFKRTRNAYIYVENEDDTTARTDADCTGTAGIDGEMGDDVRASGEVQRAKDTVSDYKQESSGGDGVMDKTKLVSAEDIAKDNGTNSRGKDINSGYAEQSTGNLVIRYSHKNYRAEIVKHYGTRLTREVYVNGTRNESTEDDLEDTVKYAREKLADKTRDGEELSDSESENSDITAAVFYQDCVIVYDKGLQEAQLYNSKMTLHRIIKATDVFDMAVTGHILYMTVPKQKTVYGYNLHEKKRLPSIQLTHKCYGLDSFDNKIAILLCDTAENDFQIAFMKDVGVVAGKTDLSRGEYQFKKPQYLAVCSMTRLAYVSDRKANLLKCFRLDGGLCWEKVVIGAGPLAIYSGYLIMARAYTSSVDVFAGGGEYKGRLRSVKYAIVRPRCIAAKEHSASFVLVDEDQLIHRFKISTIYKIDPKTKAGGSRACAIL